MSTAAQNSESSPIEEVLDRADRLLQWSPKPQEPETPEPSMLEKCTEALGQRRIDECGQALHSLVTWGDLFDIVAGELTDRRGVPYTFTLNPDEASQHAYDVAFFDLLEATVEHLRRTWGGYHGTLRPKTPLKSNSSD